jgi:DNA-binding SARP family transcriptional activator/tetratricopeptide (TPR) repeat protein
MEFGILGPLEIIAGPGQIQLGGTRQEIVIATLLLNANRVVTMERLLEAIYGENLPPTCRSQVQISISSLRRLFAMHNRDMIIATRGPGYVMQVVNGQLDSHRFEQLVASAGTDRDAGKLSLSVARYRDALRLWRGPALHGIDSQLIRAAASRLDELRVAANEELLTIELNLGRHHELVSELVELVEQYPLRERLRGHLMLALHRCGRTAEALQVFRQARRTMIEELGIEPGERLQQLERAILRSDPSLDLPTEPVWIQQQKWRVPNLLPSDIADFTGRMEEIQEICGQLVRQAEEPPLAVPILVIAGRGGTGKTVTAMHASHMIASHFPDGQLFADLHGAGQHPVSPMQALERFLRALGVPGSQIPEGLDERAEMYRNLLAERKILVVLDDAASESQVLPLLPGSGSAAVIITSRRGLAGLAGASRIGLEVFEAHTSLDLLARIAGPERVHAQIEAASAVAEYCGHLPLALRIAGARLAAHPHWRIQHLAERLADETHRLDELRYGEMGIRPSISFTYENTSEGARQLFRRLALLDLPGFSGWLGAALLDKPLAYAEELLDELVSAQLIETTGDGSEFQSQYRFHDIVRVFARERLAAEEPAAERSVALERALGALLYLAEKANRRYYGGDYVALHSDARRWSLPSQLVERLVRDPLSWYEYERITLVAGVRQAASAEFVDLCWSLAFCAVTLFESKSYFDDWRETHHIALEATRKARHGRGQAAMLYSTGSLYIAQQQFSRAHQVLDDATRLFRIADDEQGVALVACHVAFIRRLSGQLDEAEILYKQALATFRKKEDHIAAAYVLHSLAQVKMELSDIDNAMDLLAEALRLTRIARCERIEAQVLHRIGESHLLAENLVEAVDAFNLTLAKTRDIGDLVGEAYALQGFGVAKVRQGEFSSARDALTRAAELADTVSEQLVGARARLGLSELALAAGDPQQAVVLGKQASNGFRDIGAWLYDVRALTVLSDAHAALGDTAAAKAASDEARILRTKLVGY